MNSDKESNESQLKNARDLRKKAKDYIHNGELKLALNMYTKAIQIYLDEGDFLKISNIFNEIVAAVQMESQALPVIDELREITNTVEALDIPEEEAKLKMALAQLSYKSTDYLTAGNLFIEVAELFFKAEPEDFRQRSAMFLIRAAECFERLSRTEKSEKLIMEAITRFDIANFNLKDHELNFDNLVKRKKFADAVEELREIAGFFRRLEDNLVGIEEENEIMTNLKRNVEARLLHIVSEYNLLKMVLFRYLENLEKIKQQAERSITDLTNAIQFLKEEIKDGDYSITDLKRLTYDIFLLQVFQEYADYQVEDPIDLITRGLPSQIIEQIKKLDFYDHMIRILKLGLKENLDWIEELDMGPRLNAYREFILNSYKIPLTSQEPEISKQGKKAGKKH